MKKYIIAFIALLCTVAESIAEEPRKIIIRGDSSFPPYEFVNDKGEPDGFNIDLIRAIMNDLNLSYDLQLKDWSSMLQKFENQGIDLITGITKYEELPAHFILSKAHSYVNYVIICPKNISIRNAKELLDKTIIVQKYSLPYQKLRAMNYDNNLILVDDMMKGLKMLSEGRGDVAICPDNMAKFIMYKDGLTNLSIIDLKWPIREYCFAGNDPVLLEKINASLSRLKRNGVYNRIQMKWLGVESAFHIPVWIYFLIGALLFTALLLSIFVTIYKRRVRKGEHLLKKENEKLNALLIENKNWLERYQTVFNTTLVGLNYYDKNGMLIGINDEMMRLLNINDREQLLKERIFIYQNPIFRNNGIVDESNCIHEFHGILKVDLLNEKYQNYFSRFICAEHVFYIKMDVKPIKDASGELTGILVTAIDQTAEVNHERQMQEQETKLDLAMDAGNIAAWIYEPQTQTIKTLKGKAIADKGLSMEENMKILHPDDRAMQQKLFNDFVCGEIDTAEAIFRYIQADGTYRYYESRMRSKKEEGKVVAVLGTQKDITEEVFNNKVLNATVEKLRFAIQTANMAMWEYDCLTEIFTSYNDPVSDYQDGTPVSMSTYDSYFQKDGTNWQALENATRIMKNGEDQSYNFIVKMKTKYDTDWQYCTVRAVPMEKDENGKVIKYLGVRLNITEQINYQKFLEQEKENAQQADKLKSAFLANMSHEIRTPLNAIVGFSELLQTTDDPEEREEFITIINNNNELLLRLINDILDLSKIESDMMELKPEPFDLTDIFRETYTSLKQRCTLPEVEFLSHDPYKSCKLTLDRNRLIQVATNFVTNSIKHTVKGHILMGYEYVDGGIRIYVEDTGNGISKENQNKLFQRFAKLDNFTQGTGLGLAICKAIVDAQGGRIGVESEEGKGSTFWAWFPCDARIEMPDETMEEAEADIQNTMLPSISTPPETSSTEANKKKILVAEDIDSNYMLVKAILKNYDLTRATTGKEAVTMASEYSYNAILMDIKMPVMDGIEATRRIREFNKTVPIIAVTANAFDSDRVKAMEMGCTAFLTKPIKKKELQDILLGI